MKKIIFGGIAIILILGGFAYYQYGAPRGGDEPRGGLHDLTIRRADNFLDGDHFDFDAEDENVFSFTITNHSSTTDYFLKSFEFYPGPTNEYNPRLAKHLKVSEGSTLMADADALWFPSYAIATSTPAYILPASTSKTFQLKISFLGGATSTDFQVSILKAHADTGPGAPEEESVYRETDNLPLGFMSFGGPRITVDSAIFSVY